MASDARVRYTKMVIRNSFIELLKTKYFHEITLKEVCELAQINRSTFYKYYRDIYDWRDKMEQQYLNEFQEMLDCIDNTNFEKILIIICTYIKENVDLFTALYSKHSESDSFKNFISQSLEKAEMFLQSKNASSYDFIEKLNCYYCIYGSQGVFQYWIENGLKESPADIAKYLTIVLEKTLFD